LVISGVAIVGSIGLGFLYSKTKGRFEKALNLVSYIVTAAQDRKLTTEEVDEIWKRINDLKGEGDK
jgi:hypothetical protein